MRESIERIVVNDDTIDNGDHHDVLDPVWWLTNIYDGAEAYNQSLDDFSREQRLILAIEWYFAEVNNGRTRSVLFQLDRYCLEGCNGWLQGNRSRQGC